MADAHPLDQDLASLIKAALPLLDDLVAHLHPIDQAYLLDELGDELRHRTRARVRAARDFDPDLSWAGIGATFDVTKSSAYERFS